MNSISNDISRLQKLNSLFEESNKAAKIGVWEVDLINDTVFWSSTTKKIHGVSDDYTPNIKEAFDFIKKDENQDRLIALFNEAIKNGKAYETDVKLIKKDGSELWTKAKGTTEFKDNKCIRIYGTFQDIQEQKDREAALIKAQNELAEIAGKFKGIFNSAFQFIGFLTPDGTLTEANESAISFAGLTPEDVIGKKFWDCHWWKISKATQEELKKNIERAAKGEFIQYEVEILGKEGATTTILFNLKPLKNDNNEVYSIIPEGRLIQDIVDTRKELINKNNELSQFSTIVSHDLKEPLRMINQFMQKIDLKYAGSLDDKARKYIYYAVDGAKRMSKMIDELLNYSKLTEKDKIIELVHTNSLVYEILKGSEQLILEKNITVEKTDLPDINGNITGIKVLFNNLINNAIKYADPSKLAFIKISCISHPAEWEFCIEDNGIGIDPENHQKIFDLFYKINKYQDENSSGIGLAICKKIVSLHKGNIWVESDLGTGSKFYFTIKKSIHA